MGFGRRRFPTATEAGSALKRLGYEVSAAPGRPWYPTGRDMIELSRFAGDFERAFLRFISPDIGADSMLDAISEATDNRGRFVFESIHKLTCCSKCHYDWEEKYVAPYLSDKDKAWLAGDHARLISGVGTAPDVRRHINKEMEIFRAAGVPRQLLKHLDAEHRAVLRRIENG